MYLSFHGLNKAPFTLNPDPDFLYLSEMHQAALTRMECSLLNQAPFTVLSGNIGMGKTTLIRHLLKLMYMDKHYTVGLITNTHPTVHDLLKWILFSFELDFDSGNNVKAYQIFYDFLVSEYAKNRHVILIIDEAQNLNVYALEELRLISNINIDKHKVLQTFIVGQESLLETLKKPELTQIAQRVAYSYHLEPFNRFDTHAYIQHRLEIAGAQYRQIFSIAASDMVYHYSKGIPRLINVLCDTALIYGYADDRQQIDTDLIDNVVHDKKQEGILPLSEKVPSLGDQIPDEITSLYTTMAENAAKLKEQRQKKPKARASNSNQKINQRQRDHSQQTTKLSAFVSADNSMPRKQILSQPNAQDTIRFLLTLLSKMKDYWRLVNFQNLAPLKRFATPLSAGVLLLSLSCLFIGYWLFNNPQSQKTEVAKDEPIASNQAHLIQEQPNLAKIKKTNIKEKPVLPNKALPLYQSKMDTPEIISPLPVRSSKENQEIQKTVVVREGDSLKRIIIQEFGEYNQQLVIKTLRVNPNIKDADRIFIGQVINLPQR